jgi:hypothetical protein
MSEQEKRDRETAEKYFESRLSPAVSDTRIYIDGLRAGRLQSANALEEMVSLFAASQRGHTP